MPPLPPPHLPTRLAHDLRPPCGYEVVEYARQLTARVVKGGKAVLDHFRKAREFKYIPPPSPVVGYCGCRNLVTPLVGAQGYQGFPLSKPVGVE